MNTVSTALMFVFVLLVSYPISASAQSGGCPWCVTPTRCELIGQATPVSGCYVAQGEGCVALSGDCEPQDWLAVQQLEEMGFPKVQRRDITVAGRRITAYIIGEDNSVVVGCGGMILEWYVLDAKYGWTQSEKTLHDEDIVTKYGQGWAVMPLDKS